MMGALCAATGSFACGVWLETTEHAAQLRDQAEMHAASLKESQRQTLAAQAELADVRVRGVAKSRRPGSVAGFVGSPAGTGRQDSNHRSNCVC